MQPSRPSSARQSSISIRRPSGASSRTNTPSGEDEVSSLPFNSPRSTIAPSSHRGSQLLSPVDRQEKERRATLQIDALRRRSTSTRIRQSIIAEAGGPRMDPETADSLFRVRKLIHDVDSQLETHAPDDRGHFFTDRINLDEMVSSAELVVMKEREMQMRDNSHWDGVPAVELREKEAREITAVAARTREDGDEDDAEHYDSDESLDGTMRVLRGVDDVKVVVSAPERPEKENSESDEEIDAVTKQLMDMQQPKPVVEPRDPRDLFAMGVPQELTLHEIERQKQARREEKEQKHLETLQQFESEQERLSITVANMTKANNPFSAAVMEMKLLLARCQALVEMVMHEKDRLRESLEDMGIDVKNGTVKEVVYERLQKAQEQFAKVVSAASGPDVTQALQAPQAAVLVNEPSSYFTLAEAGDLKVSIQSTEFEENTSRTQSATPATTRASPSPSAAAAAVPQGPPRNTISPLIAGAVGNSMGVIHRRSTELRETLSLCATAIIKLDTEVAARDDSVSQLESKVRVANENLLSANLERDEYKRELWMYRVSAKFRQLVRSARDKRAALFGEGSIGGRQQSNASFGQSANPAAIVAQSTRSETPVMERAMSVIGGQKLGSEPGRPASSLGAGEVPVVEGDFDVVSATVVVVSLHRYSDLWETYPSAMPGALALFSEAIKHALLVYDGACAVLRSHGHTSFAGDGGYHMLLFRRPKDATGFAMGLQYMMNYLPWPQELTEHIEVGIDDSSKLEYAAFNHPCGTMHFPAKQEADPLLESSRSLRLIVKYCEHFSVDGMGRSNKSELVQQLAPFRDIAVKLIQKYKETYGAAANVTANSLEQALSTSFAASAYERQLMFRGPRAKIGISHGIVFVEGTLPSDTVVESSSNKVPHLYGETAMAASMLCGGAQGGETLVSKAVHEALTKAEARTELMTDLMSAAKLEALASGAGGEEENQELPSYYRRSGTFWRPLSQLPSVHLPKPAGNVQLVGIHGAVADALQVQETGIPIDEINTPHRSRTPSLAGDIRRVASAMSQRSDTSGPTEDTNGGPTVPSVLDAHEVGAEELFEPGELVFQLFPSMLFRRAIFLGDGQPSGPKDLADAGHALLQLSSTNSPGNYNVNWWVRFNPLPALPVCLRQNRDAYRNALAGTGILGDSLKEEPSGTLNAQMTLALSNFNETTNALESTQGPTAVTLDDETEYLVKLDPGERTFATPADEIALLSAHLRHLMLKNSTLFEKVRRNERRRKKLEQLCQRQQMAGMVGSDMSPLRHAIGILLTRRVDNMYALKESFEAMTSQHMAQDYSKFALCPTGSKGFFLDSADTVTSLPSFSHAAFSVVRSFALHSDHHDSTLSAYMSSDGDNGLGLMTTLSVAFDSFKTAKNKRKPKSDWFSADNTIRILANDVLAMLNDRTAKWFVEQEREDEDNLTDATGQRIADEPAPRPAPDPNAHHIFPAVACTKIIVDLLMSAMLSIDTALSEASLEALNPDILALPLTQISYVDGLCGDGELASLVDKRISNLKSHAPLLYSGNESIRMPVLMIVKDSEIVLRAVRLVASFAVEYAKMNLEEQRLEKDRKKAEEDRERGAPISPGTVATSSRGPYSPGMASGSEIGSLLGGNSTLAASGGYSSTARGAIEATAFVRAWGEYANRMLRDKDMLLLLFVDETELFTVGSFSGAGGLGALSVSLAKVVMEHVLTRHVQFKR